MTALTSEEDVSVVTGKAIGSDSARVQRLIELVSARVVRALPEISFVAVVDETVVVHPTDGLLFAPRLPVTAVDSVTIHGNQVVPPDLSFTSMGEISLTGPTFGTAMAYGRYRWPSAPATLVYSYGFADGAGPEDLSLLVAEVVGGMWLGGEARAEGVQVEEIGNYKVQYYARSTSAWHPEHDEILESYRRGVGVA